MSGTEEVKASPTARGGIADWIMPEKVQELLKHVEVDPSSGQRTITLPNMKITFDPPAAP